MVQDESCAPSRSSRVCRHVRFAAQKTWQDRGGIIRHSKEFFTPANPNRLRYSPLPTPSSIRLLELKSGKPSDRVQCSLKTLDLSDNPKYYALSYTWELDPPSLPYKPGYLTGSIPSVSEIVAGGIDTVHNTINRLTLRSKPETPSEQDTKQPEIRTHRQKILCDGKGIYVKPNLYQALSQLRKTRTGLYWIDALCINQNDLSELSQQVQMMNKIYNTATQVIIWLGTCPRLFSPGMTNLLEMTKVGLPEFTEADLRSKDVHLTRVGTTSAWHLVLCVIFLVTRKWFTRLWVLQELCLAREAIFHIGDFQFQADDISDAFGWVSHMFHIMDANEVYTFLFNDNVTPFSVSSHQAVSLLNSRRTISEGHKVGLQDWFRLVKDREARDPRDMVYGGLALIKPETLRMDPNLKEGSDAELKNSRDQWPSLNADYTITFPAVLEKVATCLLSGPDPMNLLSLAARYRTPYFYEISRDRAILYSSASHDKTSEIEMEVPSWYAIPWLQNPRAMKPLTCQRDTSLEHISNMTNNPSISLDGKSLFLDTVQLGTIESCVLDSFHGDLTADMEMAIMTRSDAPQEAEVYTRLRQIYHYSPQFHLLDLAIDMGADAKSATQSPLEVLCDVLTAGAFNHDSHQNAATNSKMIGFCQWLDDWVFKQLDEHREQKAMVTDETPSLVKEFLQGRDPIMAKLEDDYARLQKAYPDQPWSPADRTTISEARKGLASHFASILQVAQTVRAIFKTNSGKLILAPAWAEKGDVIMAVKGGKFPYVFTPKDEDVRRRISFKEKCGSEIPMEVMTKRVGYKEAEKWDLASLQNEIGRENCYMLTGEAYLHGSSLEDVLGRELEFGRIEIV